MTRPTKIEAGNGWGEASLTAYIASRDSAAALKILGDPNAKKDVIVQNAKRFNPHRWQRGGWGHGHS
jgi:hypothetical protein